jgi:hypothetical protein
MSNALLLLDQLHEELGKAKALPFIPWQQTNRQALVSRLKEWHIHTKQAKDLVQLLIREQIQNPELKEIQVGEVHELLHQNDAVLARNITFEEEKLKNKKLDLSESITVPTLGSEMDARMHQQWLSLNRLTERMQLVLRKTEHAETNTKELESKLFGLLKTKETELEQLKKERDVLKRDKFFGNTTKKSHIEMEQEMQELMHDFAIERHVVGDHLTQSRKKLEEYSANHTQMENKIKKLEHLVHELTKKHVEIQGILKTERDFARKVAMDLESETATLRATYAKELLNLEENKHRIKREEREKLENKLQEMESQTKAQRAHISELEALVREKERQISRIAEKAPSEKREENSSPETLSNPFTKRRKNPSL